MLPINLHRARCPSRHPRNQPLTYQTLIYGIIKTAFKLTSETLTTAQPPEPLRKLEKQIWTDLQLKISTVKIRISKGLAWLVTMKLT